MLRRLALSLPIIVITTLFSPSAFAHEFETDNGISAVMHIEPDDSPKASRPAKLEFFFSQPDGPFLLNDCQCRLAVSLGGQPLAGFNLKGPAGESTVPFTFSEAGTYQATVHGYLSGGQTFTLNFPVAVTQPPLQRNDLYLALAIAATALATAGAYVIWLI